MEDVTSIYHDNSCRVSDGQGGDSADLISPGTNLLPNISVPLSRKFSSTADDLHILAAKNDSASEIRNLANIAFAERKDNPNCISFVDANLRADADGNLPAMVAALNNHKESLMALLLPFMAATDILLLDQLLHHRNANGQCLLSIVVHHRHSLFTAHTILVESEAVVHNWNSQEIKHCFQASLGSTAGARATLNRFQQIEDERRGHRGYSSKALIIMHLFSFTFLVPTFFWGLDVFTDSFLLYHYFMEWLTQDAETASLFKDKILFLDGPIEPPEDPCQAIQVIDNVAANLSAVFHTLAKHNISLDCYPGVITGSVKFLLTLFFILLPPLLYFFELLRFRLFSRWIDFIFNHEKDGFRESLLLSVVKVVLKFFGNLLLWTTWPLVVFFLRFWRSFRFETSRGHSRIHHHRVALIEANLMSFSAAIIEVSTEASLQPLFQLYMVFSSFINWANSARNFVHYTTKDAFRFLLDKNRRQILSIAASVMTIARPRKFLPGYVCRCWPHHLYVHDSFCLF